MKISSSLVSSVLSIAALVLCPVHGQDNEQPCSGPGDCGEGAYCGNKGMCMERGMCMDESDCKLDSNVGSIPLCVGNMTCTDGACCMNCLGDDYPVVEDPILSELVDKVLQCQHTCLVSEDCGEHRYCSTSGVCMDTGMCFGVGDCELESNVGSLSLCAGTMDCTFEFCTKLCDGEDVPHQICVDSDICGDGSYCTGENHCMDVGMCKDMSDCESNDNTAFMPSCEGGTMSCSDSACLCEMRMDDMGDTVDKIVDEKIDEMEADANANASGAFMANTIAMVVASISLSMVALVM